MKNIFQKMSIESLKTVVSESKTIKEVLIKLGMTACANTYRAFNNAIEEFEIDTSHFYAGIFARVIKSNDELFVLGSICNSGPVRRRILRDKLFPYACKFCGNTGEWQGAELILQMDHINGDNRDNRLENLRFLCPNCHTQTPTYGGKKPRERLKQSEPKKRGGTRVRDLVQWPDKEVLYKTLLTTPINTVIKNLHTSLRVLKRKCEEYGIDYANIPKPAGKRGKRKYIKPEFLSLLKEMTA